MTSTITTNTTQLTRSQEDKVVMVSQDVFESTFTSDFWHFSLEGNRMNLTTFRTELVFEVHSSKGSFNGFVQLNNKKEMLKSTLRFEKI